MDQETLAWLRTLGSVGLGAVLGVLMEPVKKALTQRLERRRIRKLLYRDVVEAHLSAVQAIANQKEGDKVHIKLFTGRYDHIFDKQRDIFYQLSEAGVLVKYFSFVSSVNTCVSSGDQDKSCRLLIELYDVMTAGRFWDVRLVREIEARVKHRPWIS